MSFTDQYNALKKKREEEEKKKKKTSSFDEEYEKLKAETSEQKITLPSPVAKDKIFHSSFNLPQKKEEKRTWFDSGAFDDGYQFGDVTKTILGSVTDVRENLGAGILGIGEKVVDAGAYLAGGVGGLFGADEFKEKTKDFIAKDLYDEKKIAKKIIGIDTWSQKIAGIDSGDSVLGDKADSLVESGGQLLGTMGLQAVGVPWFVTSGVTSFGGEAENAFNQGASYGEAGLSAAISAGSEILTEKLFGGSGLGEKGLVNLDGLTKGISSKLFKALADYGVDMAAEGAEEVFSQVASNLGSALYKEENLQDLLFSEEAIDGYIESFIGGAALGGFANVGKVTNSIKTGKDYRTDLTDNEQKVFDKVYENEVASAEKDGKLTEKEKAAIYDRVMEDMEKGYISTDTIESILGDKSSFDALSKEAEEFKTLYETEGGKLSEKQRDRLAELKEKNKQNPYEDLLKKSKDQFSQSVFEQVKADRLSESYRQKAYRGQSFQADVSQYDKKQQEVVQKAIDSGFLNNTRRTHEFVDMVAKISADKGVLFDFTNNEKLKTSGFAVDGKFVNGYFDKKSNSIGVNIDSSKSLNSVVGHEITHVLEGTEVYDALKKTLFDYAKAKGDYQGRYDSLSKMYENIKDAEVEAELAADLVGDYLFTDSEFIHRLSTENRNVFQKIWDEVKYLCKVATAGSKEARELEKVKRAFEKAYRGEGKAKGDTKYSISPETDTAYMDAVNRGDTDTAQKMVEDAAKKAGYTEEVFHGMNNRHNVYKSGNGQYGSGVYFTYDKGVAKSYGGIVDHLYVKAGKIADYDDAYKVLGKTDDQTTDEFARMLGFPSFDEMVEDWENDPTDVASNPALIDLLMSKNFEGFIDDGNAGFVLWDFDGIEYRIKSADPVTYDDNGNVIPLSERFKAENKDIRYSLSDSDGKKLTKEQREYFKDSKARDENGNLQVVYHGSRSNGFTVFQYSKDKQTGTDYGKAYYFTSDRQKATGYSYDVEKDERVAKYQADREALKNRFLETRSEEDKKAFLDYRYEGKTLFDLLNDESYITEGGEVKEVYLNLTNPLIVDAGGKYYFDVYQGYFDQARANGNDGIIVKNVIDNPRGEHRPIDTYIAFSQEQIKNVSNKKPTADPDIRYSVSEEQNQKGLTNEQEVEYSISYDTKYADSAIALNKKTGNVSDEVMQAQKLMRERVAERLRKMVEKGVALPKDKEGNTFFSNSSYGGSEENTTICPRSLAPEAFMDAVSEMVGRPLTVEEQIYIGQDLMGRMGSSEELRGQSFLAQCVYCYVAADRMAQREYLGEYIKQRDSFLQKVTDDIDVSQLRKDHRALAAWFKDKKQAKPELSQIGELYREFLDGRKPTGATYKRVKMWLDAARNGKPMIDGNHLANIDKLVGDISAFGDELKPQIQDAWKYAQSASWAKKRVGYVAYNGHIQKWDQKRINDLNKHYGLRLYSFSDFHPAFVLENMQMVSDAAVQGLKMLGYTKDTDFVEIFAPTGMNINVSTFGFEKNGGVYEDNRMGTEWAKAQELRAKYPNVGITFVATNDAITKWALKQDWIDVVIPYHMVKTGETIAQHFGFTNYTKESADQKTSAWKQKGWSSGHDSSIAPPVHNNDLATYLAALNANGLEPRFKRFLEDPETRPYYMKLVNECRQSASQSKPVQPVFNEEAIERTLAKLEANGYYQPIGGSVERMYEIAAEVAEDMTKQLAPAMSISEEGQTHKEYGNWNVYGEDVRYNEIAPVEAKTTKGGQVAGQKAMYKEAIRGESDKVAKILFEGQQTQKQKSAWKWAREHIFSHGAVFEDLSLKTGNRELQAKFDNIRRAESRAQTFIGKGKGHVKALVDVRKEVEKAGKTEDFNYYLYHLHNVDRMTLEQRFKDVPNKSVFGDSVDAEVSRKAAMQLEILNPEFKGWAEDVYTINKHLRQMMVDEGIISQETAELWQTMYPHYVPISRADHKGLNVNIPLDTKRTGVNAPIKKAEGGNSDFYNVFDTMGSRIEQTYKAIAKNRFGVELMNTLGTQFDSEQPDIDSVLENMDSHEELLQEGKNGESPSFTVFQNGERVKFAITEDMYDAMKPSQFTYTNEALRKINNIRRDILTTYSPTFALTNPIKDIQDILMNSQHPAKTYASIPEAIYSVMHKDQWYQERMENGGAQDSYFDGQTKTFKKEDGAFKKVVGWLPSKIQAVNEVIEQVPRMAEYIASRKMGRSIDVSMLDAARVTTNFGAAGDFTNMLNRNGFTFLGASIEGFNQQVRNVREAKAEGAKGWAKLAGKCLAAGLPAMLLNHLLWDDDEDYAELSDYVKQNYYVVAKTEEGKFIRIPKGRTVAVIQDAFQQMTNLITGNDKVDFDSFAQLVINNLAPNNPLENNLIAPVYQAYTNKTWYGDDLVPTRLQKVPAAEQFDETTDSLSKWLGDATDTSPYKWNYLLDQYSGGIGDMILPYLTPEADGGGLGAAMRDKFVTDPVLKNQNVTDFYDTMDELTQNANSMYATDEDVLKNKYMSTINSQLSELYQKKREIQGSDMSDAEKYEQVRDIQSQIVELTRNGLSTYGDVNIDGVYATIGDVHFRQNKGEWQKITDKQLEKQEEVTEGLGITPSEYWENKDEYDFVYEYPDKYKFLRENGVSYEDYANGNEEFKEAWTWAAKNPEKFTVSKAVADDVVTYRKYTGELYDIKADKDEYGKSISGSRKEKVIDYINGMDLDYGAKIILFKSEYEADDSYNYDIIEYLNGREDISYDEMETILKELGFHVDSEGNITWD